MRTVIALGAASASLFTLAVVQLFGSKAIDLMHPGHLVALVDNPSRYYAVVGATIILALALGALAVVVLHGKLAKNIRDQGASGPRSPFR